MLGDRVDHLAVGVLHQLPSHRRRQSARAGARAGSGRGALAPPGLLGRSGSGDLEYPSRTSTFVQKKQQLRYFPTCACCVPPGPPEKSTYLKLRLSLWIGGPEGWEGGRGGRNEEEEEAE